jgi:drug/metabolite transporter (DMT)-like permease
MSAAHGRSAALATIALIVVTAVWGSTFFLIKDVVQRVAVADFLAVRFVVAAAAMALMFARPLMRLPRRQWLQALALGVVYGVAQLLQTTGQIYASASVSGFVTGMYVVFTPLLGTLLLRQRMPSVTWIAVLLATGGLALLSLQGFSVNKGVVLVLISAALYGLHIVGLGQWSRPGDAFALSTVQMLAIAAVCLLATLPHGPKLPPDRGVWFALEPVFAAGFAVAFGGESLTWRMLGGGALVLAAMYLVELAPRRSARKAADMPAEAIHHEV